MNANGGGHRMLAQLRLAWLLAILPLPIAAVLLAWQGVAAEAMTIWLVAAIPSAIAAFRMLGGAGKRLHRLAQRIAHAGEAGEQVKELAGDEEELRCIADAYNQLRRTIDQTEQKYRAVTIRLMVYSQEIEKHQKQMREELLLRSELGRYVGQNVVEQLVQNRTKMHTNEERQVTVIFADARSFTAISESLTPEEVIAMLNAYFEGMVAIVFKHHGVLDKFVGDQLMAVFGLMREEEHALHAVQAAIEMRQISIEIARQRRMAGLPAFEVGIGINSGRVVVGNVGATNRMDYTVIGDAVNVAARLEGIAGERQILTTEATYQLCGAQIPMQPIGVKMLRNRGEPIVCYQVSE